MRISIMMTGILLCATLIGKSQKVSQDSLARAAAKTEEWEPVPEKVQPGKTWADPPSDAYVLFNGKNLDDWECKDGSAPRWKIEKDGSLTVVKGSGDLITKTGFGSCQLHIEWRMPAAIAGKGQSRGNSGIYLMSRYEVQVLDSYDNPTYVNGQAGSIYKQYAPLVNASRKPGEWQSYDIIFTAPDYYSDGQMRSPARITVFHNGVLVQNNVEIKGSTQWIGQPAYQKHTSREPILLQDHGFDGGNPVSYRNIWIRDLDR
jgi:hypothetical protein